MNKHNNPCKTGNNLPQRKRISIAVGLTFSSLAMSAVAAPDETAAPKTADANKGEATLQEIQVKAERTVPAYKPEQLSSPKFSQPLRDIPQSITIVPKEVLSEQNAQSLQDILKNVPGITFTSGEGNLGWGDMFTIRGFSSEQSLTVDGMRDAGMSSRNDTFNLQQAEVYKGTGSVESGVSAVGGTVNLVSKEAKLGTFYNASIGVGTDNYVRGTADLNHQFNESSALRVNLMRHSANVSERDVVKYDREGIAASLGLGLGTPTRIYLDVFHQKDDNTPDGGLPIQRGTGGQTMANIKRSNWYGADSYTQQTQSDAVTLKVEHDITSDTKFRNQLRWAQTDNISVLSPARFYAANANGTLLGTPGATLGYVGVGGLTNGSYTDFANTTNAYGRLRGADFGMSKRYTIIANQSDLSLKFDTGTLKHDVVTGIDLYQEKYGDLARSINAPTGNLWFDMANPAVVSSSVATMKGTAGLESTLTNAGLYATDTITINPQWKFLTALRYDYWKAETSTKGVLNTSSSDGAISGRVGVIYKPIEAASLYASYARAAQPSAIGASTNNNIYGSADAAKYSPAKSETTEIGGKWDVVPHTLALTSSVFRTEVSDSWEYTDADASPVRALPSKRVQGIELGIQGEVSDSLSVYGGLARMWSKQTKGINKGAEAKNVPDLTFNLWTTYSASDKLKLSYGAQYVGKRRYSDNKYVGGLSNNSSTVTGPAGNAPTYVLDTEKAPSYWVHSLSARYKVNRNLSLNFNVDNIFNKFYWSRIGSSLDGFQLYGVPGAGRSATLSADISF